MGSVQHLGLENEPSPPSGSLVVCVEGLAVKHRCDFEGEGVVLSGLRMRRRLVTRLEAMMAAGWYFQMWTLTYDPWAFVPSGKPDGWEDWSEEDKRAFYDDEEFRLGCLRADCLRKRDRHVGYAMKRLREEIGDFEWVAFLEYQENGMPHIHLLILQQKRVHVPHTSMLLAWGMGGVRFSRDKAGKERDPRHAARYATYYNTKGFRMPAWMPDETIPRYLRFVSCSRGFWGDDSGRACAATPEPAAARVRPEDATLGEVRRSPGRWRKAMMRCILDTGEFYHRLVKADMQTCVHLMNRLGFVGGYDQGDRKQRRGNMTFLGRVGQDKLRMLWEGGGNALLDYLAHCGESEGRETVGGVPAPA